MSTRRPRPEIPKIEVRIFIPADLAAEFRAHIATRRLKMSWAVEEMMRRELSDKTYPPLAHLPKTLGLLPSIDAGFLAPDDVYRTFDDLATRIDSSPPTDEKGESP